MRSRTMCWGFLLSLAPFLGAYEVSKGDCLWTIAAQPGVYGDPWKWPLLYEANRGMIQDPDLIYPGATLQVPGFSAAEASKAVAFARAYGESRAPAKVQPPAPRMPMAELEAAPAREEPAKALPFGEGGAMILKVALLSGLVLAVILILALPLYFGLKPRKKEEEAPPPAVAASAVPMAVAAAAPAQAQVPAAEAAPAQPASQEASVPATGDEPPEEHKKEAA